MNFSSSTASREANNYSAESSCQHCASVIRHEPWCVAVNEAVFYAYLIVLDPRRLSLEDELILHALGVTWARNKAEVHSGSLKGFTALRRSESFILQANGKSSK